MINTEPLLQMNTHGKTGGPGTADTVFLLCDADFYSERTGRIK